MHRLATWDDFDAVYALYMHEEVVPFLGLDPMPPEDFRPHYANLLATRRFQVVEQDGRVQGFYRTSRHAGRAAHVGYLATLAVSPERHGSGFAREMVETVIERLRADGVLRVELMVEADNHRAQAFYRKLGFEHEGTLRAAYKRAGDEVYVDELFFARLLPPLAGG
ncbi:GNAT family N-acetyltransferase [Stutzerimonas azotifigens]|uniref:GNAT family N-acetyltransferase n=1 Tax=Stutzerimonas azotifigens TaxID=291995 RepID=UPI0004213A79|nr:GNAT family N-acetyltransferase [Stutzerimonas azotifigens]